MRLIDADALKKQIEDFNCKDCNNYNFVRCRACHIDDAISYLDEAPTVGGWISVKERLPEKDKDVIIYGYYVGPSGAIYPTTIVSDIEEFKHCECVPVAWMPLPEPPEET